MEVYQNKHFEYLVFHKINIWSIFSTIEAKRRIKPIEGEASKLMVEKCKTKGRMLHKLKQIDHMYGLRFYHKYGSSPKIWDPCSINNNGFIEDIWFQNFSWCCLWVTKILPQTNETIALSLCQKKVQFHKETQESNTDVKRRILTIISSRSS